MTTIAINYTIDQAIDAIAAFLQPFDTTFKIIRGQQNRAPMPKDNFILLTELFSTDLSKTNTEHNGTTQQDVISNHVELQVQIDIFSVNAGDVCRSIQNGLLSSYGYANFPAWLKPIWTDNGVQSPFISGEQQWVSRWMLTAAFMYQPTITVTQQSATALAVDQLIAADVIYTP